MQPVRIFHSALTNTIYAARRYSQRGDGLFVVSSAAGSKNDVTQEAIAAVIAHREDCARPECECQAITLPPATVTCKFCNKQVPAATAHRHAGGYVGDDCCWDERLRSSE